MRHRTSRAAVLLAALGLLAASCGSSADNTAATAAPTTAPTTAAAPSTTAAPATAATTAAAPSTTAAAPAEPMDELVKVALIIGSPRNDLGWSQAGYEGVTALEEEGLIDLEVVEALEFETSAVRRVLTPLLDEGFDLIIAHSFSYGDAVMEVAPEHPDVAFAWAGGFGGTAENVADYDQPFHETSYLAGILAGGLSETGVLGGTAGFDIPVCHAMLEGFVLGAREVNPDASLIPTYIGSWVDVALTKEAVLAQAEQGADMFVTCGVDAGTIEGARETGGGVLGYVVDQSSLAPENIFASMVWNLSETFRLMVADIEAGTFAPAKFYSVGLADNGLYLALNDEFAQEIPADAMAKYEEVLAQVQAGQFEIPFVGE